MGFLDPPVVGNYVKAEHKRVPVYPASGAAIALDGLPNWKVRGLNISKVGSSSGITWWTTDYDWAGKIRPAIDGAARLGCNTIRVNGSSQAYAAGAVAYKVRFEQILDYAKGLHLRVIYSFINGNWDTPASSNRAAYAAMVANLITDWAGDTAILAWEHGNELDIAQSDIATMVANLYTDIKAVDAVTKITGGSSANPHPSAITLWNPYVDFHDIHLYSYPSQMDYQTVNPLDMYRPATTKPILIGEFGANHGATGAPGLNSQRAVAAVYRKIREWAASSNCMGAIAWQYMDDDNTNMYGLYSLATGLPRAALAEFMQFPDIAMPQDAVRYRSSPIVLDNFARVSSALVVGASPLGGSPIAVGTWGIIQAALEMGDVAQAGYLVTGDASGFNALAWDARTGDVDVDGEFKPAAATPHFGVIARYADINNYLLWQYDSGVCSLVQRVAGVNTVVQQNLLNQTPLSHIRLRLRVRGTTAWCYIFDDCLAYQTGLVNPPKTNTQHGVWMKSGTSADGGSRVRSVAVSVPLRGF